MAYLSLALPPGIYRNGTQYQAKGRWFDSNLIRFYEGAIRPWGGWLAKTENTVTGKGRAIITWKDNSALTWTAVGTEQKLYAISRSGFITDITPLTFAAGYADALTAVGFGTGLYGSGLYGQSSGGNDQAAARGYGGGNYGSGIYSAPPPDTGEVIDATVWSLDTWGQYLLGVTADDGKIWQWLLDTSARATMLANAPSARALVVTDQRILMALGAGGNPRAVQWSDQENNTLWTPDATNQAGSFNLQTAGRLMLGKRFNGAVFLLTDIDLWLARYTADVFVYSFEKVGSGCGAISQNCAAVLDNAVVWMGNNGFFTYNGFVEQIPCAVNDYVFANLNAAQKSKVTVWHNSSFGEVTWFYPQGVEVDSYVSFNYRENHWSIGSLSRLSAADRGTLLTPLLVGNDGFIYEHEVGFSYDSGVMPYLESGPFELGNGDSVMYARQLVPDDRTAGDVTVSFKTKFYPDGAESSFGPYTVSSLTDVRFSGRSARLRYDGVTTTDWRVGTPRLEVVAGGRR